MNHQDLLQKWYIRARRIQGCHYYAASRYKRKHNMTGLPLVGLAAVAGSNAIVDLIKINPLSQYSGLILALISLAVAILSAMQVFLSYEKKSLKHYHAGVAVGNIKRKIEILLSTGVADNHFLKKADELRKEWHDITKDSPSIPQWAWKNQIKRFPESSETYPADGILKTTD